ncbi:MAG: glycosyltransferase family 4 protein [Candidatus Paceibacteria bacterium]
MKIAQVSPAYPPYGGGMGKVVQQTSSSLEQLGHKLVVFTPDYAGRTFSDDRVCALTPKLPLENIISKLISIDNAAPIPQLKGKLSSFDLVHLHYPFFGTDRIVYNWSRKNKDTPLVVTYHMDPIGSGLKEVIFKIYRHIYQRKILTAADKIIASTFDYIKHSFASHHFSSNKGKWAEVPFGVDLDKFKPTTPADGFFNTYKIESDKKTALFVGGMDEAHEFKGVPLLFEAFSKLENKQNYQLVLVGEGALKSKYEKMAEDLGLEESVNFVGYINEDRLSEFYSQADVFVLPSVSRNEAFGLVLLESIACNTPVIASDLPGVREVAKQAGTTFQVGDSDDLAEKINSVLNGSKIFSESLRERIQDNDWSTGAERIEAIYQDLV